MFKLREVPLPNYSRGEEIVNSISHAAGVPLCIVGLVLLLKKQIGRDAPIYIVATILYISSICLVFLGSAIYHGMKPGFAKQVARVIDHSNIYIMLSGSSAAFYLAHVYETDPKLSKIMITVICVLSAVGIVLTFMNLKKFNIPQIFMYIALGWATMTSMRKVYLSGPEGKHYALLVLIGGVIITVGAMLYLVGKKVKYFHAVFHFFVLAGCISIYIATYDFAVSRLM